MSTKPSTRAIDKAELERLFLSGMLLPDIAKALCCQVATVRRRLGDMRLLKRNERGPLPDNHKQKPVFQVREAPAPLLIDRDPCFYCGTRGDMGCRHNQRKAA